MKTDTLDIRHMDCMALMAELPDKSQHLIIVDPPYFEVKGGFDFIWASFEDYLKDVEKWAKEMKRVLADNGTLFWWGHAKKIAYSQIILDKYFNLENNLKWEKKQCQTKAQDFDQARTFAPITEHVLMYSNEVGMTGLEFIEKEYIAPRNPFARELKRARLEKGVSINQVAEYGKFYGNVNHGGAVTNWEKGYNVPLESQWKTLCDNLPIVRNSYEELRNSYEELRKEYEELRRPFNNDMKLTDVLLFSQEAHETGKHNHPTQKPPTLCRALIRTCSKRGMNLLVPFMGSGTECVEGANLGLNVTASELDEDYYKAACERIDRETSQTTLKL